MRRTEVSDFRPIAFVALQIAAGAGGTARASAAGRALPRPPRSAENHPIRLATTVLVTIRACQAHQAPIPLRHPWPRAAALSEPKSQTPQTGGIPRVAGLLQGS